MMFVYCMLALFVGSQAMYTNWLDRDNPSGTGDWETVNNFPQRPCGGKATKIQVRVKGDSTVIISATKKIRVGPKYGLVCRKVDQPNKKCLDFSVRYMIPLMSKKFDRDDPSVTGDWELKKLETGPAWKNGKFIYWHASSSNYGLTDELLVVGPRFGLRCLKKNQPDNTCRDYQVRFLCPFKITLGVAARKVGVANPPPENPEAAGKSPPKDEFVDQNS